jgi:hypothetical protein
MLRKWIRKVSSGKDRSSDWLVREWVARVHPFFILGMGRSGTNFLAAMLDRCPDALVFHEPISEDFNAFVEAHKSDEAGLDYFEHFRLGKMHELTRDLDIRHYGEVNSALRYHARAIKTVIPEARLLHLVRDGREVVRSVMERRHYTDGSAGHHDLHPLPSDPLYDCWKELSRFEKVCWLWTDANRRLAEDVSRRVAFESLVGDYDYFRENLLSYLDLEMSEALWAEAVQAPTNVTRKFTFPPWQQWDEAQHAAFETICGEQMSRFGYK